MLKMKIISIIILVVFTVGLAGCGTTPSTAIPVMVNLESPFYLISGENSVEGFTIFFDKMELIYGDKWVSLLGGYPLVEGVEMYLEDIREGNSILVIPSTPEGIQEFRDLENKYPDLCPLSCDTLESELDFHSSPLIYFSQDIEAEKLIGIIVADQVDASLAELLSGGDGVPLDISFRYENGQLLILE